MSNVTNGTEPLPLSYVLGVAITDNIFHGFDTFLKILLLILVIVWRNVQPIKSRYPLPPILCLACLIGYDLHKFLAMWVYANAWPAQVSTARHFFVVPYFLIYIGIICHQYVRYFVNRYLDDVKNREDTKIDPKMLKLFRFLASNWTLLIGIVTIALIVFPVSIILTVVWLVVGSITSRTALIIVAVLNVVLAVMFAVIIAMVAIWDFVKNIKPKGVMYYFGEGDPFNFRTDGIFCLISLILGIISIVSSFIIIETPSAANPGSIVLWIYSRIIFQLFEYSLIMISGGTCVFSIIKRKIKASRYEHLSEHDSELERILNNKGKAKKVFEEYCKSEFASENILCYDKIKKRKSVSDLDTMMDHAREIHEVFVKQGTLMELNITQETRNMFNEMLASGSTPTEEKIHSAIDMLECEVLRNLQDVFMRFQYTSSYEAARKSITLKSPIQL